LDGYAPGVLAVENATAPPLCCRRTAAIPIRHAAALENASPIVRINRGFTISEMSTPRRQWRCAGGGTR